MARVTPRLEPRDHGVDRRGPSPPRPARPLLGRGPGSGRGSRPTPGGEARRRGARPGGRRRAGGHRPSWSRPPPPLPPSRPPAELLDGDRPAVRELADDADRATAVLGHVGGTSGAAGGSSSAQIADSRFDFPVLGSPTIAAIASGRKLASRSERNPRTWTVVSPARVIVAAPMGRPRPAGTRTTGTGSPTARAPLRSTRTRRPPPSPVGRAASGAAGKPEHHEDDGAGDRQLVPATLMREHPSPRQDQQARRRERDHHGEARTASGSRPPGRRSRSRDRARGRAGDVADHDRRDLDVPDRGRRDEREVDDPVARTEEVPAEPERVGEADSPSWPSSTRNEK